jgi:hypothetical protein
MIGPKARGFDQDMQTLRGPVVQQLLLMMSVQQRQL